MPNPYAAKRQSVTSNEPPLPLARLRRLGSDAQALASVTAQFDELGASEKIEFIELLARLTDDELQVGINEEMRGRVPAGSAHDVLTWVNKEPTKAQLALDVELSGRNRAGLVVQLQKIIGAK